MPSLCQITKKKKKTNHNRGQIQQQFGAQYKLGADVDCRIITVSHGSRASIVKTLGYSSHMDPRAANQESKALPFLVPRKL